MLHVWPSTLLLLTLCCGIGQAELKSSHNDTPLQSRQRSGTRRDPWKISKLITDLSLSETVRTDLVVKYGYTNVVSDSMVTPEMAVATPQVKAKIPVKCMAPFALVMVDADAPSPYKPTARSRLHWLVVNANSSERLHEGDEVVPYEAPNPAKGTGPHRFVFLAYCQFDKRLDSSSIMPKKRDNFNLASFAKGLGTGKPFAGSFFYSFNR
ncbi:hypothetical protein V5799_025915 [Amblyomma americanum]|uniref:Phosphatidylethanolamine-binding protein n=1 Tax=Amblyomma americanum TaxID=6943 RepID=A0AAQ4DK24_AMBAM